MEERVIRETSLPLKLYSRGKVRDIYDLGDRLLIVATDRISAFDVVMPNPIPDKGRILTQLSKFWFDLTKKIVPNHLISTDTKDFPEECRPYEEVLKERSMLVAKTDVIPVECVVRGYLSGSAWEEYKKTGEVCGIRLSKGLVESSKLEKSIFTPATKAELGMHDENITYIDMVWKLHNWMRRKEIKTDQIINHGSSLASWLYFTSLEIYKMVFEYAFKRGIIIADTKMEFGLRNGRLMLIDELLTPDSSRFWPENEWKPGGPQKSFDKQFLRDYLLSIRWDKNPPAPHLPEEIVQKTRERYQEALRRLIS